MARRRLGKQTMKLTTNGVAALTLPAGKADHIEWDETLPGFGVRLRGGGKCVSKTYIAQFRVGRRQRRRNIGDVRKITIEDARKVARNWFAQVALGTDPAAERERSNGLILRAVVDRYLEARRDRLRPSSFKAATRYLAKGWKQLHDRPLDAVHRADVAAVLQEMAKARGRVSAARARETLSALFSWAMREGLCESNPVIATNDPSAGIPPRDRVLNDDEIRAIWAACEDDDAGRIIKLLLLTGCRREEIGALKWSEINLGTGVLSISGERTKNYRMHELILPEIALDILRSAPRHADRGFVFGRFDRAFSGWSTAKLYLDARIAIAAGKPIAPWRLHDLRRTMRTNLGKLGVQPHIAELCLNHTRGGVEAIYDRHRYQREIAVALALWADHLLALVEGRGSKVVSLRAQ